MRIARLIANPHDLGQKADLDAFNAFKYASWRSLRSRLVSYALLLARRNCITGQLMLPCLRPSCSRVTQSGKCLVTHYEGCFFSLGNQK